MISRIGTDLSVDLQRALSPVALRRRRGEPPDKIPDYFKTVWLANKHATGWQVCLGDPR